MEEVDDEGDSVVQTVPRPSEAPPGDDDADDDEDDQAPEGPAGDDASQEQAE
jgi:hypothetical protein